MKKLEKLEILPVENLQEIKYSAVFHQSATSVEEAAQQPLLDRVVSQCIVPNWRHVYDFLGWSDLAVKTLYEPSPDGGIIFPGEAQTLAGHIGDQTSRYHRETLRQHAAIVTARLHRDGVPANLAVALGVLHDIGKKYTTRVNQRGELCFIGHAAVSAYIAALLLPEMEFDQNYYWQCVAAIYGHMLPREENWVGSPRYRHRFFWEVMQLLDHDAAAARWVMETIDQLDAADTGCVTAEELTQVQYLICEGEMLIENFS